MSQSATASRPNQLPETMQAIVAYAPGDYRLETVEVPRAGPDDVIIEVEACGICASDIKTFEAAPSRSARTSRGKASTRSATA